MQPHKTKRGRLGLLQTWASCPLKTAACTAKRPRWIYNFNRYRGRCISCPRVVKTVKRIHLLFGDSVKIRWKSWPEWPLVFISCPIKKAALCHGRRWLSLHSVLHQKIKGACQPCHKDKGGTVDVAGYRRIRVKLHDGRSVYRFEHRCVMEKMLGRKLRKGETVHHKNSRRVDNRKRNLELRMSGNHPQGWSLRQMREYLKTVPKRLGGLK